MTAVTSLAFGLALKRARRAARLTQAELAERAGFSVVYVSMLERGARQPQRTTLTLLADALTLADADRATLEGAAQLAADRATSRHRRSGPDGGSALPIGAFLGAAPPEPLVGCGAELDAIHAALDAVAQGHGRLLMLVGEPGVGKTRLAQQITITARAQGFHVLTGRCYEPQQTVAYTPFVEALTQAVALTPDVVERWPEVARLLPSSDHDAHAPAHLDDGRAQQRLFYQVCTFLGALTDRQPLALLLDDVHWADGASLELLQHLARQTRDLPILLVGTARAVEAQHEPPLVDALSDLRHDELLQRIEVERLAEEEASALIGVTLGGADGAQGDATTVSAALSQRIYARSDGNAFFIRQLTRALQEQGDLTFATGRWDLSAQDTAISAPESIRSVIGRRLGRLTAHTQEVLREASVLGQVFAFDELQGISQRGEQEVEEALEEAAGRGIVREGQRDQYHFNHALTLETLAADLSARRKRRLHRAAGAVIESQPDHERRAAELAYHFLAADESERALPYALLAGDQAEAVYAHAEAEKHYRAALAAAQDVGDASHKALALEKLGAVVHLLGRSDEAPDLLDRALRSYQALQDQEGELRALAAWLLAQAEFGRAKLDEAVARTHAVLVRVDLSDVSTLAPTLVSAAAGVYTNLAWIYSTSGRHADTLGPASRAVELARAAGDEKLLALALFRLIGNPGFDGDVMASFHDLLALAERTGQTAMVVTAHNNIGGMLIEAGEFALARPHIEQAVAMAERRQDPRHLAWQLHNFTWFLFDSGDWPRARETYARAEAIMREVDRHGANWQSVAMSIVPGRFALVEGREEEGRRLLEQAIERIKKVGTHFVLPFPVGALAEADLLAGRTESAQLRLTSFLPDPAHAEDNDVTLLPLLAWAEGALGQLEQAEARLKRFLAGEASLVRVDALRVRGLLATMQGDWDTAAKALDEALERTRVIPSPYAELKALWVYGQLEAARSDPAAARKHLKQALLICDRLGEGLYRKYVERDLRRLAHKDG
jgi:tetratricopeptide (TPR) repeat protein/transcriptional regulator with XRE-family HTH domain